MTMLSSATDMPRPPSDSVQIAIRVPPEWLKQADEVAKLLSRPGMIATRTDAFRAAIAAGLEAIANPPPDERSDLEARIDDEYDAVVAESRQAVPACAAAILSLRASFARKMSDPVFLVTEHHDKGHAIGMGAVGGSGGVWLAWCVERAACASYMDGGWEMGAEVKKRPRGKETIVVIGVGFAPFVEHRTAEEIASLTKAPKPAKARR